MRAERRNISITNESVSQFLDTRENVSKFLENLVLDYMEEEKKRYAEQDQVSQLEDRVEILQKDFEIMNENYKQERALLSQLMKIVGGKAWDT